MVNPQAFTLRHGHRQAAGPSDHPRAERINRVQGQVAAHQTLRGLPLTAPPFLYGKDRLSPYKPSMKRAPAFPIGAGAIVVPKRAPRKDARRPPSSGPKNSPRRVGLRSDRTPIGASLGPQKAYDVIGLRKHRRRNRARLVGPFGQLPVNLGRIIHQTFHFI